MNWTPAASSALVTASTLAAELRPVPRLSIRLIVWPDNPALRSLDAGDIIVATEPDYIRSRMASRSMTYWWALFNADWLIVEAPSDCQFLTSDNPVAFIDPGPFRKDETNLRRFLPLTPKLSLVVVMDLIPGTEPDFTAQPKGSIKYAVVNEERVDEVNRAVIQCAEDMVFCAGENTAAEGQVREFARFRTAYEYLAFGRDQSIYQGIRLRVLHRPM